MKNLLPLWIMALLLAGSCSPKEDVIIKNLIGTWVCDEIDGKDLLTNDKFVSIFEQRGTQIYAQIYNYNVLDNKTWGVSSYTYSVKGHTVSIVGTDFVEDTWEIDENIKSIDRDEKVYKVSRMIVNGKSITDNKTYHQEKASDNYTSSIVGLWEGRNVTPGISETAAALHRWEYKADGSYDYYFLTAVNGETVWTKKDDNTGRYFLYGDFLATNWTNDDISGFPGPAAECWEIDIDGNTMKWTGHRENNSTVKFEMTKIR